MRSSCSTCAAIAALLALAAPSAFALGEARSQVYLISMAPLDLRPDDGITPWFDSRPIDASLHLGVVSNNVTISRDSTPAPAVGGSLFLPAQETWEVAQAYATLGRPARLSNYAYALHGLGEGGYVESRSLLHMEVVLGAYTGVALRGYMQTEAYRDSTPVVDYTVISTARVAFADADGVIRSERSIESRTDKHSPFGSVDQSEFVLYYGNNSADLLTMDLYYDTRSFAMQTVAAVPEPAMATMLGAGLLLTGGVVLRRRRAS